MDYANIKLVYSLFESIQSITDKDESHVSVNDFMHSYSLLCNADDWLVVYNNLQDEDLRCVTERGKVSCEKSLLVEVLPLLFQSSALALLDATSTKVVASISGFNFEQQLNSAFYSNIELTDSESVFLVFFRKSSQQAFREDDFENFSILDKFANIFLKSSDSCEQSDEFVLKLRDQVRRQNVWMEALSWINHAEVNETLKDSTHEFYQGLLFQLSTLMHADDITIFDLENEEGNLISLEGHNKLNNHDELTIFVSKIRDDGKLRRHSFWNSESSSYYSLENLCFSQIVLLPLFLQQQLSSILCVIKNEGEFDTNDMAIGRLFSEGVEKIIERRWLLGSINEHIVALQAEKEEQRSLISQLKEAQGQLLQNEKMASIGQLAAGVAHEINNPVGYFSSNLASLTSYMKEIFTLIDCYEKLEKLCPEYSPELIEIKQLKQETDVDFLKEDIDDLLNESLEGVTRVRQIVNDLKDFSHVDEAEWQWTDIHQGIDSTLNIVANELKYKAEIIRDYGQLPNIECIPSQLNQVFMNMLVNAGHAIEKQGKVTIKTLQKDEDTIIVEFTDSGKGIKKEDISRIFEPFFTTKPIGKGTGLGLSLSYGIIDKHSGSLSVDSEVGVGTTFRIELPINQSDKMAET
jgi:two-component system, NtrC family, sensor kinase